jgi:hypothetical protein
MAARKPPTVDEIQPKTFSTTDEIDRAIAKLQRRTKEIEDIDIAAAELNHAGALETARNNLRNTILEIYGPRSPEYRDHEHISFWAGPMMSDMTDHERVQGRMDGRTNNLGIINGLIGVLREKREDLEGGDRPVPSSYFEKLNLHPRIADVRVIYFLMVTISKPCSLGRKLLSIL